MTTRKDRLRQSWAAAVLPPLFTLLMALWIPCHGASGYDEGELYRFTFAPPGDGVPFTAESKITRTKTAGNQQRVDEIRLVTSGSIRKTKDGYVMGFETDSFTMKRDGVTFSDPMLSLYYAGDSELVLDDEGRQHRWQVRRFR